MRIWKEMFVICLKADLIAFVEAEKKREQLLTLSGLEQRRMRKWSYVPTHSLNYEWW